MAAVCVWLLRRSPIKIYLLILFTTSSLLLVLLLIIKPSFSSDLYLCSSSFPSFSSTSPSPPSIYLPLISSLMWWCRVICSSPLRQKAGGERDVEGGKGDKMRRDGEAAGWGAVVMMTIFVPPCVTSFSTHPSPSKKWRNAKTWLHFYLSVGYCSAGIEKIGLIRTKNIFPKL